MKEFVLTVTDSPSERAVAVVDRGIDVFNAERAGYWESRPLAVLASDPETAEVLGGFIGHTSLGLLFIDLVWLPDAVRGARLGSRMLAMMEAEARERGCKVITGVELFVRQAALQFQLFSGKEPPLDAMRAALRRALSPVTVKAETPVGDAGAGS